MNTISTIRALLRSALLAACICALASPAFAGAPWQHVSQGTWLNDVTYGAGRYVATGFTGIYTSTDGFSWQQVSLPPAATPDYHRILWNAAQHQFVTVGYSGAVLTSPDGMNWTLHSTGSSTVPDVIYADGQYVAVSDDGKIVTSADGQSWMLRATHPEAQLFGIAWSGSRFIAVGRCNDVTCSSNEDIVFTSTDGVNWTSVDPGTSSNPIFIFGVAWGNGRFVIVGAVGVITSTDGLTWTRQTTNPDFFFTAGNNNALRFENGNFVATGFDNSSTPQTTTVFTSSDGVSWNANHVPDPYIPDSVATAAEYINGNYYVTASDGSIFGTDDLVHWTTNRSGSASGSNEYGAIAYGGGRYLTDIAPDPVSSAYISLDGITWNQQGTRAGRCVSLGYGAGLFVCSTLDPGAVYTSPNGDSWIARTAGIGSNTIINDILATGTGFVAAGSDSTAGGPVSAVLTSADGITWAEQPSAAVPGVILNQIVTDANGYFALGNSTDGEGNVTPHLLFSPDGSSWSELAPDWPGDFNPTLLVGQSALLVAAGNNYRGFGCPPGACQSEIFTSADGSHWVQQDIGGLGVPDASRWSAGTHGGGLFEFDGIAGDNANLAFLSSHDGVHWTYTQLPGSFIGASFPANSIFWSGDQFLTNAAFGGIFRLAGVPLRLSLRAPGSVRAGRRFRYRLRVQNTGTDASATGVTVTDRLPDGAQFLSARVRGAAGDCTESGQTVTCTLSSPLAAGARAKIVIRVQAPGTTGDLDDSALAVADQPVIDGSGNAASATTTVVCHRHCSP